MRMKIRILPTGAQSCQCDIAFSTSHASGRPTDYAIVTCDHYSAPQHGHLDCCSPARHWPRGFDVENSALLTAPFTVGMCRPTAAVDQVTYSVWRY